MNKVHEAIIEKQILLSLNHPNIIKILSTFQDKEKLYYELEYAENKDLNTFIRTQGLFDYELAKFYSAQIVNAIEFLHLNGIAHRDLKPENIMLDHKMHIKLVISINIR
jgi:serine/threonine protein kinase